MATNSSLAPSMPLHVPADAAGLTQLENEVEDLAQFPLSFSQQRLWFLDQLFPGSFLYNIQSSILISGEVDPDVLQQAINEVAIRHGTLRTRFVTIDGQPAQVVAQQIHVPLRVVDLTGLARPERTKELSRLAAEEAREPFDLLKAPLLRTVLVALGVKEYVLLITIHHIIADGWSMAVLEREIRAAHAAMSAGHPPTLERLPIQYTDYAKRQRESLIGDCLEAHLSYWSEQLRGAPTILQLPSDRPQQAEERHRGASYQFRFPKDLAADLRDLGRRDGTTLFMTLLAGFATLLCRYSRQDDVMIGVPVSGRSHVEFEPLVGLFVNTIVLRMNVEGGRLCFRELLKQVRRTTLDGLAHQELPFERVVELLNPERRAGRNPVFQVMFELVHLPPANEELASSNSPSLDLGTSKFDLSLSLRAQGDDLVGAAEYNSDLFDAERIERMMGHFQVLLEGAVATPGRPVGELPLLTPAERHRILVEWNDTAASYPLEQGVHQLFEQQAARSPDAVALIFEHGQLSYRALNEQANRLAHYLIELGVGPEVLVAICMERSPALIVGLLAILKAGGAYVPLDPTYPAERLAFMLDDARPVVVLTQTHVGSRLPSSVPILDIDEVCSGLSQRSVQNPPTHAFIHDHVAYVIYTSGSTGRPKGVMVSHRALVNHMLWMRDYCQFASTDRILQRTSISFDAAAWEIHGTFAFGGSLVIVNGSVGPDIAAQVRHGAAQRVTTIQLVPSSLRSLIQFACFDSSIDLQRVVCGGEALPPELQRQFFARSNATLYNFYGPTEAAIDAIAWTCRRESASPTVPIGRPIANTRIYLLDGFGQPVPIGVPGEIYIAGAGLARGYLNRPELTAERFVPDPFAKEPGGLLYRTGDLGRYLPDGNIEYLGRSDHQVKVRGFRIEPGEIESALAAHPVILENVVIAREDRPGEKRLVGYIVARPGMPLPTTTELRRDLAVRLPEHMVPSAFVWLDRLPLTPNGKIDRLALPLPDPERPQLDHAYAAPRTPAEAAMAKIWCAVLGLERVGIHDDFFQLGGDSILSIQVVARARRAGFYFTPRQFFGSPTIEKLLAAELEPATSPIHTVPPVGEVPLTPIQRWYLSCDPPHPEHFNQSILWDVPSGLSEADVHQIVRAVFAQHDALRLQFRRSDAGWKAWIPELPAQPSFEVISVASEDRDQTASRLAEVEAFVHGTLDLEQGPITRFVLFRCPGEVLKLLTVVHHLAIDSVSWRILGDDFSVACEQMLTQGFVRLGPKSAGYRAWALHLQDYGNSSQCDHDIDYWTNVLLQPRSNLPRDNTEDAANTEGNSRVLVMRVPAARQLLEASTRTYHARFDEVLLGCFALCIARWSRSSVVFLNLESHGRDAFGDELDISKTVGWFTSIYPLRLVIPIDATASAALCIAKQEMRRVPRNGSDFGVLRYLTPSKIATDLAAIDTAEICFNYLGRFRGIEQQENDASPVTSLGPTNLRNDKMPRRHLLEIDCWLSDDTLIMQWTFCGAVHQIGTVERLAKECQNALEELSQEAKRATLAEPTPSDFPLARISSEGLAHIANRVGTARISDIYPLSPGQEGILFESLLSTPGDAYIEQILEHVGCDTIEALRGAWQAVINRHDALRTSFDWGDLDPPHQIVWRELVIPWELRDWQDVDVIGREAKLREFLEEDRLKSFDLTAAPPIRFTVCKLSESEAVLLWTWHHILLDGWSVALVHEQVQSVLRNGTIEDAIENGRGVPRHAYREYIAWLQRQDRAAAKAFWSAVLAESRPLSLSRTSSLSGRQRKQARHLQYRCRIEKAIWQAAVELARKNKVTPNSLVAAIVALLIHRHTGQDDVLFHSVVSGRPADLDGVESMVGLFVNSLPVRVLFAGLAEILTVARDIQEQQSNARQFFYLPLYEIQRLAASDGRLTDTLFIFQNYPRFNREDLATEGNSILGSSFTVERTNYPLTIEAFPSQAMDVCFSFDASQIDAERIERMMGHFQVLLEAAVAAPGRPVGELPLLTPAERHRILVEWNDTAASYPLEQGVHQLFEQQAARSPDAVALIFEHGQLSYRALNEQANRLAHYLIELGVGPEVLVAVCMERSPALIVGLLAILKAGGAYVPLDPTYPAERLAFMLDDARPVAVLTQNRLQVRLPCTPIQTICLESDNGLWGGLPNSNIVPGRSAGAAAAYVIYTSGSTGLPKGVVATHASLINRLLWMNSEYPSACDDIYCQKTSISFVDAVCETFAPLVSGARLFLSAVRAMDAEALTHAIESSSSTRFVAVPALLQSITTLLAPKMRTLASVRLLVSSGEALDSTLLRRIQEVVNPKCVVLNLYGSSEVAADATFYECGMSLPPGAVPIGRPIANTRIYLLDRFGQPVPIGVPGQIYIAGAGLVRGYLNRPELTAERFVPDPFAKEPGGRLYRTGDLGRYRPDGNIEYLGRTDHQVKVRGFRIEPAEIESALAAHPVILENVVIAREDRPGEKRLVGYIVARPGMPLPTTTELRRDLAVQLPEHMVPSAFVWLDRLPLTPNGKIDRLALPLPDPERPQLDHAYAAPRTPAEAAMAKIWCAVLGLERVGIHDDFFQLGGHSLLAVQVAARLRSVQRIEIPLHWVFDFRTIASLADQIVSTADFSAANDSKRDSNPAAENARRIL